MKLTAIKLPFSPKTLNIIVLILGVLILAAILYYSCANREGFDGNVPRATQTSAIPSDIPGASSSNPTIAKPQAKDIQAALDEAEVFFILVSTFDVKQSTLPIETKQSIAVYRRLIDMIQNDLKKALANPESSEVTLKEVTDARAKFTELSKAIRSHNENPKPASPESTTKLALSEKQALAKIIEEFMNYTTKIDLNKKINESHMDTDAQMKLAYYVMEAPEYYKKLNGSSEEISAEEGAYLKKVYMELIPVLQSFATPNEQPTTYESTVVAGTPGVITLKELQNLVSRIDDEYLRLANLRSTSATLQARQSQLEKLAADVRDLIGAVQRNEMKLEDVPITSSAAEAFLKQINASEKTLPPLIEPRAKIADGLEARITPSPFTGGMNAKALHGLLDSAKYLKWNLEVKLEYDPKLAARDNLLKRIEGIERRLSALAVSETPISKQMYEVFMKELQTINNVIAPDGNDDSKSKQAASVSHPSTLYTRTNSENAAEYPSVDQIASAAHVRDTASGNAILNPSNQPNPDVFIRPGFVMNDDTIRRRASASAFDDSLVGGADYKKRSQDLCRQIRGANLGEPDQFGCISNPDSVSPDYSWKGNFTMVCNRLGDTWGGWYPEMFGCPKYDPTQKFKATMM